MESLIIAGIALVKVLILANIILLTVSYLVYFERKISAWAQSRVGPNRVGYAGLLQPFADVFKLLLKEDIVPEQANKTIHTLAPFLALFVAFTTYAVIPWGPDVTIFGRVIELSVVPNINAGILYVLALTSIGVYAITLSGWSSGSKYSLLGGVRASAQMISYEISMGFSVAGVLIFSQSLLPSEIVKSQSGLMWNAFLQPIGFITFVTAAFAETNRLPFDLPEAEPELVGGFHTEYSSMKFAAFFLAEYANMMIASALIVTLYLGGWQVPYLEKLGLSAGWEAIIQVAAFFAKLVFLMFFFIWVRWSIPRFRYDQLMDIGWKVMFPLALLNVIWAAVLAMLIK
ncbi:MAG: NADH-quinone oxidoreductase subunit NuoH [Ignavibacteriaceae bacterium]|jgi:NADH-quinone oxidoreductase subunit H|nr:NADH-quinone oxidoreductase subunit NuoH [Ignavibacteriaceae bacterium]